MTVWWVIGYCSVAVFTFGWLWGILGERANSLVGIFGMFLHAVLWPITFLGIAGIAVARKDWE
jgi:hypothetical protein